MNQLSVLLCCLLGCLTACPQDITVRANAKCDGVLQPSEDYVDSPFDFDGDGYYDAQNNDCVQEYGLENLDCDDRLDTVNPGEDEILCNGEDDDCNEQTLDGPDADGDGSLACDDCDDDDPNNFPGNEEVCDGEDNDCDGAPEDGTEDADLDGYTFCDGDCDDSNLDTHPGAPEICDGLDNNCNGVADENCETFDGYTGTWVVPGAISYACAFNSVTINVSSIQITDVYPTILLAFSGGNQPGAISGSFSSPTAFTGTNAISSGGVGCDETYSVTGTFTSATSMTGTLTATFFEAGGFGSCFGCANQTWQISAVR